MPRVGELIDLYSFIDTSHGDPPVHWYEVVQVVHKLYDVTDKVSHASEGHHFVSVYVKPSQSSLFRK